MTWERLILLCLKKKQPKKFQTHARPSLVGRGAGYWWLSGCTVAPAAFWKLLFLGHPLQYLQISGEVKELFYYLHFPSIVNDVWVIYDGPLTILLLFRWCSPRKVFLPSSGDYQNFFLVFNKRKADIVRSFRIPSKRDYHGLEAWMGETPGICDVKV